MERKRLAEPVDPSAVTLGPRQKKFEDDGETEEECDY
jgi:hypothetical protein